MNIMGFGATHGAFYALERMRLSNGGKGGRIVTTASFAGFMVQKFLKACTDMRQRTESRLRDPAYWLPLGTERVHAMYPQSLLSFLYTVQINVIACCTNQNATFEHIYLDSRVLSSDYPDLTEKLLCERLRDSCHRSEIQST